VREREIHSAHTHSTAAMAGYYYNDPTPPYFDYGQYYRLLPPYAFVAPPVVDAEKPKKPAEEKPKENDKKPKIIEMDVALCCENCVRKVQKALHEMDGVVSVNCDIVARKVIVTGDAKPDSVLKKVRKVRKDAQFVPKKK
jgi:copper chaperone CopZ